MALINQQGMGSSVGFFFRINLEWEYKILPNSAVPSIDEAPLLCNGSMVEKDVKRGQVQKRAPMFKEYLM